MRFNIILKLNNPESSMTLSVIEALIRIIAVHIPPRHKSRASAYDGIENGDIAKIYWSDSISIETSVVSQCSVTSARCVC